MPLVPGGASGVRASTRCTMFSAQVVLAVGDEDLLAGDAVVPSPCGTARVLQRAEVRAGLRLGQVHRAGPLAGDQLGRYSLPSVPRCRGARAPRWRPGSAAGTARKPCWRRSTSRRPPQPTRQRQALAAVLLGARQTAPAAGDERLRRRRESRRACARRRSRSRAPSRSPTSLSGASTSRAKSAGLVEDRRDGVGCGDLVAWQGGNRGEAGDSSSTKRMSLTGGAYGTIGLSSSVQRRGFGSSPSSLAIRSRASCSMARSSVTASSRSRFMACSSASRRRIFASPSRY